MRRASILASAAAAFAALGGAARGFADQVALLPTVLRRPTGGRGFRLRARSKYAPHQGPRERARRARQLVNEQLDFTASGQRNVRGHRRVRRDLMETCI